MTGRKLRRWAATVMWGGLLAFFVASGMYGLLALSMIVDAPA